ncbi:MAG: hypothetical protein NVSMB4_21450 [Acidimicrobiales bacterium]
MLRLVIFDCDGVLVDTETIANRVLAELITRAGLPTTPAQSVERYMGRSMASVCELIELDLGRPLPPDLPGPITTAARTMTEKTEHPRGDP